MFLGGMRTAGRFAIVPRAAEINGQQARLFFDDEDNVVGTMRLEIADGQVQGVNSLVGPDKLRHLGSVGDLRALREGRRQPGHAPARRRRRLLWNI